MKQNIRTYSLIIICGLLVVACKKYPEGGYIYKRDAYIKGIWELTLYEVNGIDSTELINYNNDDVYKKVLFVKPHSNDKDISVTIGGIGYLAYFVNSNKDLNFYSQEGTAVVCQTGYCYKMYFVPEGNSVAWHIDKLTNTDMALTSSLTNSYKLKFHKTSN
jgi:hypothetical protein